jgi:imidazolonepropionase-like amidohydrolase
MPKHHPMRFIAYFMVLPVLCGSFLAAIYNYFVIPSFTHSNFDYYDVLFIMLLVLLAFGGFCLILAFLSFWRRFRDRLRGFLEFFFFMFLSVICFFVLVALLINPTTLILGKKFPSERKFPLKQSVPIVITNTSVVDVDNRAVLRDTRVLLDHGRIKKIGSAQDIPIPSDAEVIDGEGKMLLPGLIDAHVHLGLAGKTELFYRSFFVESLEQRMERNAKFTLESGVTTVREMPDYFDSSFELKRAVEQGRVLGPKMIVSGRAVAQFGGYFGWPTFGHLCKIPREVRRAIDYNLGKGAGFIKIPTPDSTPLKKGEKDFSENLLEAAVNHAHDLDAEITAHTMWSDGAAMAVSYGVDGLEHMPSVMDPVKKKLVEKIVREGIYVIPTIFVYDNLNKISNNPEIIENPEYKRRFGSSYKIALQSAREYNSLTFSENQEERKAADILNIAVSKYFKSNFSKFVDAGAIIGVGTDAGNLLMPHGWISKELEKYVEYGMSPMDAITAATYTNALILNMENEIGRVKPGLKADLLLVDGDPTANIKDIEKVDMVFRNGVLVYKK